MTVNPVIIIPSPRNIPQCLESISRLRCPKLWIKYHNEDEAYSGAREWFLAQEFTHFLIHPDDLMMTQQNLDDLITCLEKNDLDVLSGWCKNTIREAEWWTGAPETPDDQDSSVSRILPPDPPHNGTYDLFHFIPVKELENPLIADNLIEIKFSGFAPIIISRKVIEKMQFRNDFGCCTDSCFSIDLPKHNFKQFVLPKVKTVHIQTKREILMTGKKEKEMYFVP